MARTTKTTTTSEQVDVDMDGDIDATVTTTTTLVMEGDEVIETHTETHVVEVDDEPNVPDPQNGGPTPRVAAGNCGGEPCAGSNRKRVTFTNSNVAKVFTFTPTNFAGDIAWDFGDGTPVVVGRGPVEHTYATAGAKTVKATPLASSARMTSVGVVVTVP